MGKKKKSFIGWTLKKPFLKGDKAKWQYIDDGVHLMPVCCYKGFEKKIDLKMFKKIRITIEEVK